MVKFVLSKKQSKATGSTKPTRSKSIIKDLTPSIATCNDKGIFEDHNSYNNEIKIMLKFLPSHPLFGAFSSFTKAVPLAVLFKCAFSAFRPNDKPQEVHL